jgi:hypothetical protein
MLLQGQQGLHAAVHPNPKERREGIHTSHLVLVLELLVLVLVGLRVAAVAWVAGGGQAVVQARDALLVYSLDSRRRGHF